MKEDGTDADGGDQSCGGRPGSAHIGDEPGENKTDRCDRVNGLAEKAFEYPLAVDRRSGEH